ncbi:hypothetical protein GYMLUDRAFT_438456 [Collybiopsis luxurians FD-317 M1]|uniref:Cytochrome P450 n=1 Tax=Collybiopsis luxurians FD-317 M1 TaxID=944289 RepID=A0A0D0C774_9AGAR|nr:hypothetical protein GYMLUDRAFT_438456 [Collybiopsis luxurians FD-317 M1]
MIHQLPVSLLLVLLVAAAAAFGFFRSSYHKASALPFPPGPKDTIGTTSAFDPWVQYQKWGEEYGDLVYVHDRNILILNHSHVAIDLLERRARIYSDRPVTPVMDLFGISSILSLMRYSPEWRYNRKLFQQNFRQAAIPRFFPAQYSKVHEFLYNLITSPENFMRHTFGVSQQLIYSTLYGLDIGPEHPLSHKSVEAVELIGETLLPGTFPLLEQFPWLVYMPSWFPGCGFHKKAERFHSIMQEVDNIPFEMAVNNFVSYLDPLHSTGCYAVLPIGIQKKGLGTSLIAELAIASQENPAEIEAIKAMGTISFLAAADTTMSSISSFLLCMCLNPEVQRKGQEELDRIVGRDRLPTFKDRRSLPYVEAIYQEVMRLHPPLPLSLLHSSIEDDVYRGYFIPKGCQIIPNIWAMNRDPDVYYEPDKFMPERLLESEKGPFRNISEIYAFGFGRRVCAGRHMAENTVWLTIASVLATITLAKAKDEKGNEIDIPGEYTNSFLRHPKPYQCSIIPRSPLAKDLILTATSMKE